MAINAGNFMAASTILNSIQQSIPDGMSEKATNFFWNQFVAQTSLPDAAKQKLFDQGKTIIEQGVTANRDFSNIMQSLYTLSKETRGHLGDDFTKALPYYDSPAGKRFLSQNLRQMREVSRGDIPSSSYFTRSSAGEQTKRELESLFGSKSGFNDYLKVHSVEEFQFEALGKNTSRTIEAELQIPGTSSRHRLRLHQPSDRGFLASTSASTNPLISSGENVYAVGSKFVLDTTPKGDFVYTSTKQGTNTHGFVEFQQGLLGQLRNEIDTIRTAKGLSKEQQARRIEHAVNVFNQTIEAQQHYVSSASEAANLSHLDRNKIAKVVQQQEAVSVVPVFAQNKKDFGMGSGKIIERLVENDMTFAVSSGQGGHVLQHIEGDLLHAPKAVHISQAYDHGYYFPEYRERHKMLGDIGLVSSMNEDAYIPGTRIRRHTELLPGAFKESTLGSEAFQPEGVKVVSSFFGNIDNELGQITDISQEQVDALFEWVKKKHPDMPDEEIEKEVKLLSEKVIQAFKNSNPDLPDGAMAVKENLFRQMVTSRTGSEQIKITSPGGGGKSIVGETINALFTGDESLTRVVEEGGQKYQVQYKITGMKEAGGKFEDAMVIKSIENVTDVQGNQVEFKTSGLGAKLQEKAQREINTFGLPLQQGEFIGLDAQGRQVSAESKATVQQFIRGVNLKDEIASLRMNIVTGPVEASEGLAVPFQKYVGYGENRGKFSSNPYTEEQMMKRFGVEQQVETVFPASRMSRAPERALASIGGAQFATAEILGEFQVSSPQAKASEFLINMNPEEYAKLAMADETAAKTILENQRGYSELVTDADVKKELEEVLGRTRTLNQNLQQKQALSLESAVSNLSLSTIQQHDPDLLTEDNVKKVLGEAYSPYNKEALGKGNLLSTDTERFYQWGNQAKPEKIDEAFVPQPSTPPAQRQVPAHPAMRNQSTALGTGRAIPTMPGSQAQAAVQAVTSQQLTEQEIRQAKAQRAKTILQDEINSIVKQWLPNAPGPGEDILESTARGKGVYSISIRDEGQLIGRGGRATVEPRYFDSLKASPYLLEKGGETGLSVAEEVSRRMTSYSGAIEELGNVLRGTGTPDKTVKLGDYSKIKGDLGAESFGIDLGLTPAQVKDIQHTLPEQYRFDGKVYVPSEEHLSAMGKMQGGRTLETDRPIRKVFTGYLDELQELSKEQFNPKAYADAHKRFENEIKDLTKLQAFGESGGGGHGVLRGPVQGSSTVYGMGMTGHQMEAMGFIEDTGLLGSMPDQKRDLVLKQRSEFLARSGEEGIERQVFLSASNVEKTWGDLIRTQEQKVLNATPQTIDMEKQLLTQYQTQLERLRQGGSAISLMAQDPAINTTTFSPARVYMDMVTPGTDMVDYASIPQGFGEATSGGKTSLFQTGIPGDVAGDWDGDTYKVIPVGEEHQANIRQRMADPMSIEYKNAEYEMIKKRMSSDMKEKAFDLRQQQGLTASTTQAVRAVEGRGLTAPKLIVPQISKPYELWKAAVNRSSLDATAKNTLFNILAGAEQVPISGRHFSEASEYADTLIQGVKGSRSKLLGTADTAAEGAENLFDMLFQSKDGKLPTLEMDVDIRGQTKKVSVDLEIQKQNLMKAARELHDDQNFVKAANVIRSKGNLEKLSSDELFQALGIAMDDYKGVHGHYEEVSQAIQGQKAPAAQASGNALGQINQSIIEAGEKVAKSGDDIISSSRRAGEKLSLNSLKSFAKVGAGVAALGMGLGMTLSPTFTPSKGHKIDPDFLFPEELDSSHPSVQASGLATPQTVISQGGYATQVHLPPGAYAPSNLAGRLGAMVGNSIQGQLSIHDHRMSLSAHKLDKIKHEII